MADFNDFDEKRAVFVYQNAIEACKMLEESIQSIKEIQLFYSVIYLVVLQF